MQVIRQQMINHNAPPGSAIVDGVLTTVDFAFTNQIQMICHIDSVRFQCCPNSFANTVIHEIHHLLGRQHNTKFVKDDPMSYAVAIRQTGEVLEDAYVLPPMNPTQLWSKQFFDQQIGLPAPMSIPPTQPPLLLPPQRQVRNRSVRFGTYLPLPSVTILDSRATYDPFPSIAFAPTPSINGTNLSVSG